MSFGRSLCRVRLLLESIETVDGSVGIAVVVFDDFKNACAAPTLQRFFERALHGDGDKFVAAYSTQPSMSARASSRNRRIAAPVRSALATRRLCRRHSFANAGRRVSGTRISTGRSPALRRLVRCRRVRVVELLVPMRALFYRMSSSIRSAPTLGKSS